jgi:coproporphyrinogen III oxidase-like Fe-S oxidoreductase
VDRINVDLMYGLPYQIIQGIETSVDTALTMRSERMPLFGSAQNDFIPAAAAVFDKYQTLDTQRHKRAFSR